MITTINTNLLITMYREFLEIKKKMWLGYDNDI